jgi:hypothetical protein
MYCKKARACESVGWDKDTLVAYFEALGRRVGVLWERHDGWVEAEGLKLSTG